MIYKDKISTLFVNEEDVFEDFEEETEEEEEEVPSEEEEEI